MTLLHSPSIVRDGLVLYLDAANKKSYLSTIEVEYLIVAGGGGGGGSNVAGGGGGGGVLSNLGSPILVPAFSEIYVGSGGIPGTGGAGSLAGGNGENSSAFGRVAIGGGGGGSDSPANNGVAGGSGGGARGNQATVGGNGTEGQGNKGGDGGSARGGGGGGGAGLPGSQGSATSFPGGSGGDGFQTSIRGSVEYFAGGGGGGGGTVGRGQNGEANTGGGGGGRGGGGTAGAGGNGGLGGGGKGGDDQSGTPAAGGSGGSGIVIVRYRGPQKAQGGIVTEFDGWTIHTFTSSGTFEVFPIWYSLGSDKKGGNLIGGVEYSSQDQGSFVFDGINDYITFQNQIMLNAGLSSYSFSAWWKYLGQGSGSDKRGFVLESQSFNCSLLVNTNGTLGVHINTTTEGSQFVPGFSPTIGQWYYSVVVWDGSSLIVYINSQEVGRRSQAGTSLVVQNLRIGTYRDNNNRWWVGNISQVSIYNKALTATEIKQNFNALRGRYGI
jgi:hypothetical protein